MNGAEYCIGLYSWAILHLYSSLYPVVYYVDDSIVQLHLKDYFFYINIRIKFMNLTWYRSSYNNKAEHSYTAVQKM